jgi:cytochrome P450
MAREPGQPGFSEAGTRATGEVIAMLKAMVARRRLGLADAPCRLVEALLNGEVLGRRLTDQEIAFQLVTILYGGAETVPKTVAGGLLELHRRPDQLAAVREDPDVRAPIAFEEVLRYCAPAQWFGRTVKVAHDRAGIHLKAGQRVILLVAAANRDPREFDDPDSFVWNRKMRRMLSFGIGPHFCIGIHLARLEGQIMLAEFLKAVPEYSIDPAEGVWPVSEFQIGWTSLPVRIAA